MGLSDCDDIELLPGPPAAAAAKRTLPLRKRRARKDLQESGMAAELSEAEVHDVSSASGSEFQADDDGEGAQNVDSEEKDEGGSASEKDSESEKDLPVSRKRKASSKGDVSTRPQKRRARAIAEVHRRADKGKGKAPDRALQRVQAPNSSDEEVSIDRSACISALADLCI